MERKLSQMILLPSASWKSFIMFIDEELSYYCSELSWLLLFVQSGWQLIMFSFMITVFYFYLNSHVNHLFFKHFTFIFLTTLCKSHMCYISLYSLYYLAHCGPLINLAEPEVGIRRTDILICILPSFVSSPRQWFFSGPVKDGTAASHFQALSLSHVIAQQTMVQQRGLEPNILSFAKCSLLW